MQIDLVSYKKKKVRIEYRDEMQLSEVGEGMTYDSVLTQKSDMPPTPDFISALKKMADFVPNFGVDNKGAESTEVHTVHIKREKENLAVVLCVTQKTKTTNSPFDFKTPKINEVEEAWTGEVTDAVLELMIQAEKYLAGEYAQTELEFDEPSQDAEPEAEGMKIVGQEEAEEAVAA